MLLYKYGIETNQSGVESHIALGVGEIYYSYCRRIQDKFHTDAPHTEKKLALSIAEKVCSDTAEIDGFSPILLVFCIVPRLPIQPKELPHQIERMRAIRIARENMARAVSNDRVETALTENVLAVGNCEIKEGAEVLMFRGEPQRK